MKKIASLLLIFCMLISMAGCGNEAQDNSQPAEVEPEFKTFSELNGKTISMLTGAPFEELISSKVPEVKEFTYYGALPDMQMAVKAGKTDAGLMNNAVAELAVNKDSGIAIFPENLGDSAFGFAFAKGDKRRDEWYDAYQKIPEETIEALWKKWTGADDSIKVLPKQDWPGSNGTVKAAVCDTLEPMSYVGDNGEIIGFDIEMILLMAKELDVHVTFTGMEFSAVMSSVEAGKALIGAGSIIATDERKKSVDFVEYYPAAFVLIVRSTSGSAADESGIVGSFNRTFITEGRYKMVLSGLWLTILMAVLAGIIGLILAYLLVFLRHKNNKITNAFISVYTALISGIPAVVILMVLYYIAFGKTEISAVPVAIVGFALIFAARAYGVIWNAASSVDSGQREAALALGYTENKAFRKIILPQSSRIYEPILQSQFVMLLKETSIAGYISVLELTRAGDLIRSRTMEAFFPLFAIALIYFLLTWLFTVAAKKAHRIVEKKRDLRKIKGVD